MGTLAAQNFELIRKSETNYGYTVSLWFCPNRRQYAVQTRGTKKTSRKLWQIKFPDLEDAENSYSLLINGKELVNRHQLSVNNEIETAKAIIETEQTQKSLPTLEMLFAIDRVKSKSRDINVKGYLTTANSCLRILTEMQHLPNPRIISEWRTWGKTAAHKLMSTSLSGEEKIAIDTAKSRLAFFLRAMQSLVDYGHLFVDGANYALAANQAISAAKDARKLFLARNTRKRDTYRPISAQQIRELISGTPDLKKRIFIIKVLFGFRPSEALALKSKHVFDNKVQLRLINTKTLNADDESKNDIAPVEAPFFLKLILKLEEHFNLKLQYFEDVFADNEDMCLRRLRTIAACHVFYATKDINAVKERCGHQTLEMAHHHYAKYVSEIDVAPGITPDQYYGLQGGIWLDEVTELATSDNFYDKFLLSLMFDYVLVEFDSAVVVQLVRELLENKVLLPQVSQKRILLRA